MSVLIKDMEMPKSCNSCDLLQDYDGDMYCPLNDYLNFGDIENVPDYVMIGCPLSEVPERKPGKWIDAEWENINSGEKRKGRRCSVCGHGYFRYDVSVNTVSDIPNFCPNCGADMRGEQNENN